MAVGAALPDQQVGARQEGSYQMGVRNLSVAPRKTVAAVWCGPLARVGIWCAGQPLMVWWRLERQVEIGNCPSAQGQAGPKGRIKGQILVGLRPILAVFRRWVGPAFARKVSFKPSPSSVEAHRKYIPHWSQFPQEVWAESVFLIQQPDGKEGRDDPSADDVQVTKAEKYADHLPPLLQLAPPIAKHKVSPVGGVHHALRENVEWHQCILTLRS